MYVIALKFDTSLGSAVTKEPIKFQCDMIITLNILAEFARFDY